MVSADQRDHGLEMGNGINIVEETFLAPQTPVSTRANPTCINMARQPVLSLHKRSLVIGFSPSHNRVNL
jgi:hypothetical protein